MEYNNDFKFDLSRGKIGEEHLAKILEDKTLEVKTDSWIARTQNIAVEYESRGKPSGIATTEADYWVFVFDGRYNTEVILLTDMAGVKKIKRDKKKNRKKNKNKNKKKKKKKKKRDVRSSESAGVASSMGVRMTRKKKRKG